MNYKISIIGGDYRSVKLAEMLAKEGNKIYTFGLEKNDNLTNIKNIEICQTIEQAIEKPEIVIGPIPFSSDGKTINSPFSESEITVYNLINSLNSKILIAGGISNEIYERANKEFIEVIDLLKREELSVLNTIATAEGTIELAMANTNKILHGSNVLILGFGRIGKVLARKLEGLSVNVTCAARKEEDLAWIYAYGYKYLNINTIGENLNNYDIIINTVPHLILNQEKLQYINKECLLIDLASNPGGIDKKVVKEKNLKFIWALSLPGKVAPITSAEFIKETIYNILKEINK